MKKLRVLDLFSGIGGFSLGLERTGGFETVAFCEIEPFCQKVLAKHWPEVPIYDDVRTLTADALERDGIAVDVICGGFPCQNVANVGAVWGINTGLAGERSGLWAHYRRLIDELGPSCVIIENVRSLLGNGLVEVLQDLCAIGYDAEWHAIPASYAGSPQNRDRVWIVAYPCENGMQGLFERADFSQARQGWTCRQEDLQSVFSGPFRGDRWPQPIIRGGNNRPANWVDRIASCGNAVIPQIPEAIGRAILQAEKERSAT